MQMKKHGHGGHHKSKDHALPLMSDEEHDIKKL
jgi:hypothetical protein